MSAGVAFLFPGQGAKRADLALRTAVARPWGRALCERAARVAGTDLALVLSRPSLLDRTRVYQPLITAVALAAAHALKDAGVRPRVVLGHSMGEVAAWSFAGGCSAEEAIDLCALRGERMEREAESHPGAMVALATSEPALVASALEAGRQKGALAIAAHNAPDETVLTGDEAAVRAVLFAFAGRATRVPTPGAWHSPAMAGALPAFRAALEKLGAPDLSAIFVSNRTGEAAAAKDAPALLAEQLVRPVEWARSVATAADLSDTMVTLGPGAVLRSLWYKNTNSERWRAASVLATEDPRSLAETARLLGDRPLPSSAELP